MCKVNKQMDRRRVRVRKLRKFVKRKLGYILAILASLILTPPAMYAAFQFRGYRAIGGEVLLVILFPLFIAVVDMIRNIATHSTSEK